MTEIDQMIRDMLDELERALALGLSRDEARRAAEEAVRHKYGGERIYVAAQPKARRAVQLARLEKRTTSQIAATCGISRQHAWRLKKLFKPK